MNAETANTAEHGGSIVAPEIQAEAPEKEPSPLLADGGGLRLDHVRALLAEVHHQAVSPDDPLLMVVTILNAFLGEVDGMQKRHADGLGRLLADRADLYVSAVHQGVAELSAGLSSASAESMQNTLRETDARLAAFRSSLIWLASVVAVSALVNVAVFVLLGVR